MTNYDAPFVELIMFYFNGTNIDSDTMHKMYIAYKKGLQVRITERVKKDLQKKRAMEEIEE